MDIVWTAPLYSNHFYRAHKHPTCRTLCSPYRITVIRIASYLSHPWQTKATNKNWMHCTVTAHMANWVNKYVFACIISLLSAFLAGLFLLLRQPSKQPYLWQSIVYFRQHSSTTGPTKIPFSMVQHKTTRAIVVLSKLHEACRGYGKTMTH